MIYICRRCGYRTKQKQSLQRHLQKLTECNNELEDISREELLNNLKEREKKKTIIEEKKYFCKKCNKELSSRQNRWKHEQICKKENKQDILNLNESDLKELVINLTKELENIKEKQNITINNIDNSINDNSNNMNINIILNNLRPFGKENYDYIDEEAIMKILKPSRLILYKFIKLIHFNIDHPENWNYYISNSRGNKANVYNGKKFILEDKMDSLRKLINKKKEFLQDFIKEINDILEIEKEIALDSLKNFEKEGEDYEYITKEILKKAEDLAYNSRTKLELIKNEMNKKNKEDDKIFLGINN